MISALSTLPAQFFFSQPEFGWGETNKIIFRTSSCYSTGSGVQLRSSAAAPALWPSVVLLLAVGVVGLFFFRICRHRVAFSTVLVVLLLIASTWFCNWYAPGQLARSFSKIKNVASPAFALQPISDDSVPIISSGESFGL
jgi:hypothetical protein